MPSEFWREEFVNREPSLEVNARISEGTWTRGLQWGEKGKDWMRLTYKMLSEKGKSSRISSISSSKSR